LVNATVENLRKTPGKVFPVGEEGNIANYSGRELADLVQKRRPAIRFVGLLHDLTHAPYGHTVEDEIKRATRRQILALFARLYRVDLLCADARVAVELDGAQHLADPLAYRRDRRKDQVLQENGYLVLRFLAEDVGKELDLVLDAILRALSHRRPAGPTTETLQFVRRART
jgi:very-short-patch-repair endonuclease